MLPEKITFDPFNPVQTGEIIKTLNELLSHLEEKESDYLCGYSCDVKHIHRPAYPQEKEYEYPNKNMDCYCEICIYCKEAILKNQQIR